MISYRMPLRLTAFLLASAASAGNPASAANCESLANLKLPNTTITIAQPQAAGTFTPPGSVAGAKVIPVAFCRVAGNIRPTSDSDIGFEIWLPQTGWTGRFESVGNGGFAGRIPYRTMAAPLVAGSVVASTDDGHQIPADMPLQSQGNWALGHPQKIIDYGYRAVHLTAVIGKVIASSFYGSKPKHSYFVGCSKGGQEALMEAQRYPKDFDGIIAGAPGNQVGKWISSISAILNANLASEESYISQADIKKAGSAITDACDEVDGVKDGLINDPRQCRIDVATLPLTSAQRKTFEALHDGLKTSSGNQINPGIAFGTESVGLGPVIAGPNFAEARTAAVLSGFANAWFANFVYGDPKWNFLSFDPDKSPADAEWTLGRTLIAADTKLIAFRARGGKLISYHGWADPLITPLGTLDYYEAIIAAQGRASGALERTQSFYRLFMAPGMSHCVGGPGPNQFGQYGGGGDTNHDLVAALEQWVEKGIAPTKIIATKFVEDDSTKDVQMRRPLCAYPKTAKYKGAGDTNDASNFVCADPVAAK